MRNAVIAKLEQTSGGRIEISALHWKFTGLQFVVEDITIHGSEPAGEQPFLHADRLVGQLKVISLFEAKLGLKSLEADRPTVHLISLAGGGTNAPHPAGVENRGEQVSQIFDLTVERLQLSNGQLLWNERKVPLDLKADDVAATLSYRQGSDSYAGEASAGKIDTAVAGLRPFSSAAKMEFILWRDRIDVRSLQVTSGNSWIEATGKISNFTNPAMALNYRASVTAQDLAAIFRQRGTQAGALDAQGYADISESSFTASGKATLVNATWHSSAFSFAEVSAHGDFVITPADVQLRSVAGSGLGGKISGEAIVHEWIPALAPNSFSAGKARINFGNLDVDRVVGAFAPSALRAIRLAGSSTGSLNVSWRRGLQSGEAELNAGATPTAAPRQGYLPVKGELKGTISQGGNAFAVDTATFSAGATDVDASGVLNRSHSNLRLQIAAHDLSQFVPVAAILNFPVRLVELHGSGSFSGTVTGQSRNPSLGGHVETAACDAAVEFRPRSAGSASSAKNTAPASAGHMRWDRLSVDVEIAPTEASVTNGDLVIEASETKFSGSTTLGHYQLVSDSRLNAKVTTSNANISDLQTLAGTSYPISGLVSFRANFSGPPRTPDAKGAFNARNGKALGMPFKQISGNFNVAGPLEAFSELRIDWGGASSITGSGSYNRQTQAINFVADGRNFDVSRAPQLAAKGWSAAGTANFHLEGAGTRSEPRINGTFLLRGLYLNGENVGDLNAKATTIGTKMHLSAQSDFARSNLTLGGDIDLKGLWPAQMQLEFAHLDIDPVLTRYVHGRVTEHSSIDGKVTLRGPLLEPRALDIVGHLENASVNIENVGLKSEGPIDFEFVNSLLTVRSLHIVGEATDFAASGELPLEGAGEANLHATGHLDFKILQSFDPDMVAYGTTTLDVRIGGSLLNPAITGQLQINNAGMAPMDYPAGLSDINGTMVFNENRLVIQTLTAQTGGGELTLGGFVAYSHGVYFDLTASGKGIRLRYPPGVSSSATPNLRLQGTLQHSLLSGEVRITKFGFTPQFDFAYYLARSQSPPRVVAPDSLLNTIHFDVHFVTSPALEVQTSLARLTGDADLHLRGTAAQPVILGRIDIAEGTISFSGTNYTIDRGSVVFSNPVRILPVVDLQASARVRDYDITLSFHGPIDKVSITYRSDPPLPPSDIIALLALGRTRQDIVLTTGPEQTFSNVTTNQILSNALNYAQSSRVQRLFGASRIKIDPEAGGPENNPNARLTAEEQVSNRATLTYITNLSQSAQTVIQLEFNINRQLSLVGVRDQNGVVSFSIYLRQRKR